MGRREAETTRAHPTEAKEETAKVRGEEGQAERSEEAPEQQETQRPGHALDGPRPCCWRLRIQQSRKAWWLRRPARTRTIAGERSIRPDRGDRSQVSCVQVR